MSKGIVEIHLAGRFREVPLSRDAIVIGRSKECDLVLPFVWIQERHVLVQHDAGLVRVRSAQPNAKASVSGQAIGEQSQMIPDGASVDIPTPDGTNLSLRFKFRSRDVGAAVLKHVPISAPDEASNMLAGVEMAGASALIDSDGLFGPPSSTGSPASARSTITAVKKRRDDRVLIAFAIVGLCILILTMGELGWNSTRHSRQANEFSQAEMSVEDSINRANELIPQKHYIEAKASLESARAVVEKWPALDKYRAVIERNAARPEIKWGANGYVEMEQQWLPAETVRAWKQARERDDPKIASLVARAESALESGEFEVGRSACDEALAMIESHPVKPHPRFDEISNLRLNLQNQIVAAEMTAKGFVLYRDKWVTPQEKFRGEQAEKGLVEYKGKWITKEDAFTAEQTAKGLVLFDGKWMTPDQQMTAKGFVKFEDQWITPQEKESILEQRAQAQREAIARAEAEKQRLVKEAEDRRKEAARIEGLKEKAYEMSQVFIKKQLKSPTSATFLAYGDDDVVVVYDNGWFLVRAVVDAQNGFGAMIRGTYVCKLRPTNGDRWESDPDSCGIVDK